MVCGGVGVYGLEVCSGWGCEAVGVGVGGGGGEGNMRPLINMRLQQAICQDPLKKTF